MNRLDICNLAIGRIGVGSQHILSDFEEDTEAGRNCQRLFPFSLKYVAREFSWPFLRTVEAGQLVAGETGGYGYQYAYPPNAAALLAVGPADVTFDRLPQLSLYESDAASAAGYVLSDLDEAVIWYTAIPNAELDIRDQGYCDAVAWHLARELAPALKAEPRMWQLADTAYGRALPNAEAMALRESRRGTASQLPATLQARG